MEVNYHNRNNYTPHFALFVAGPITLLFLIIQAVSAFLEKALGKFWLVVHPWLSGVCITIMLVCVTIILWHVVPDLLKRFHEHQISAAAAREAQERAALAQEQTTQARKQTSIAEQLSGLIADARVNGDNVKVAFTKDGGLSSVEVIRASSWLEAQRGRVQVGEAIQQELTSGNKKQIAAPAIVPPRDFPEKYDLVEVYQKYEIDPEHICLGKRDGGRPLWVDAENGLCHGVFNAVTGRGKTVIERGIETQLLHVGCEVLHLDLKFSLIDDAGLDYRPIAKHLMHLGAIQIEDEDGHIAVNHLVTEVDEIRRVVKWLALREIPRRLAMYRVGDHSYSTLYVFLEELLYLISKHPELAEYIGDIIVVGRSLKVKLFTAAQNFQAQNTNIAGGMRENFETAYYLGGDDYSGAKMLDVKLKDLTTFLQQYNVNLGKSVTMLRNNKVLPSAELVRTGMSSNDSVYYLLGRADDFTLSGTSPRRTGTAGNSRIYVMPGTVPTMTKVIDATRETDPSSRAVGPITGDLVNQPTEPEGPNTGTGPQWSPEDKLFTPEQEREFITLCHAYIKQNSRVPGAKVILRAMNRGVGLGNRYAKNASWVIQREFGNKQEAM